MKKQLSKLSKIELRDVWGHEAIDFTNWVAQPENLELLGTEIGIDIALIRTEASVGSFNVDILAQEESSERKIIIENQLESTDHDHLGKIVTYAAGHDAEVIIWIVKSVREEHQKAIEWLNEHTGEEIGFFLIKVEVWQIDDSKPAPKFDVIVSPNEWAKTVKGSPAMGELTATRLQQLDFWTKFYEYVHQIDPKLHMQNPRPHRYCDVSLGGVSGHIALIVNARDNTLGCWIYIGKDKEAFRFLVERRDIIETELGEPAEWVDAPVASEIKINKSVDDIFDPKKMEDHFKWLYQKIVLFQKVFGKYFRELKK